MASNNFPFNKNNSNQKKLLFQHFIEPEALFKTNDGLLIAQPDVSRQQYYNIEYNINEEDLISSPSNDNDINYNHPPQLLLNIKKRRRAPKYQK